MVNSIVNYSDNISTAHGGTHAALLMDATLLPFVDGKQLDLLMCLERIINILCGVLLMTSHPHISWTVCWVQIVLKQNFLDGLLCANFTPSAEPFGRFAEYECYFSCKAVWTSC